MNKAEQSGEQPAFPRTESQNNYDGQEGMTLRQYYAGQAMQGFVASYGGSGSIGKPENVAQQSVKYADALLEALTKTDNQ